LSECRERALADEHMWQWTVNEPADIARMLDLAVDGIISDRPDRVRTEMQKRGMQLPTATPVTP